MRLPSRASWLPAAAALAVVALASNAAAHAPTDGSHGLLYAELERGERPCSDAFALARHLDARTGLLQLYHGREGVAPDELLHAGNFTAEPEEDGDGYRFEIGPFAVNESGGGGFYFVASWTDEEGAHQVYAPFEGNCVPEGCVEHELVVRTGDDFHRFAGGGCSEGGTPDDCLSYEILIETVEGFFLDRFDTCVPEEEPPGEGEACLEYFLHLRTPHHDVMAHPGECPPSEPSCVTYDLTLRIGERTQGTWETDCPGDPCQAEGLVAHANEDGTVTLTWPGDEDALYEVMRAVDGGDVMPHAVITGTAYVDTTTEGGRTYFYVVHRPGMDGSSMCAEVTAVPFFGAPVFAALAAVGACGAYAWMRRR